MNQRSPFHRRLRTIVEFPFFYMWEVLLSNLRVAYDVLTPSNFMRPAMIELNVEGLSDRQLLASANLITMTPGTLSLDVSEDRKWLTVHAMYVDDAEKLVDDLEKNYLRRIRDVF